MNNIKIPDASGIFATVSQKFKKKKALDLEIGLRLIWYYKSVIINYNQVIDYCTSF